MSKYDKTIEISHEEEGTYHRREVEPVHYSSKPTTTYHEERHVVDDNETLPARRSLVKHSSNKTADYTSDEADNNYEEWTTSKRKVNHKTRQVETRVSRKLLMENGKVIADSGPQVTTRIKEDNREEECEKEKTPKNKSRFEALENAPEGPEGACSGRVLGEKREIQKVSREVREENLQYHDEQFQNVSGRHVHDLMLKDDKIHSNDSAPRGKMVHYSNRGKVYKDTDEILEVAKLAIDGSITKEVKRTNKHEEFSEDEKPDEKGEAEELRRKPVVERSSRRHADYVNDFDDLRTPEASDDEKHNSRGRSTSGVTRHRAPKVTSGSRHQHEQEDDDRAFPRYDPYRDLLHDDDGDFKSTPSNGRSYQTAPSGHHHVKEHSLERQRYRAESSDDEQASSRRARGRQQQQQHQHHSPAPASHQPVEIPEEFRVNKQRLLASKSGHHSPARSHSRSSTHKISHGRKEAATQAYEEEIERQSMRSSSSGGAKTQTKTTQNIEKQSTPNATRRYYYGNAATANKKTMSSGNRTGGKRRDSVSSLSSASSLESLDERRARQRQQGTRSRDSGFKSPHSTTRTETPLSEHKRQEQQIYSVSSKSKKSHDDRAGAISPTPTTGSAGQRSVKTTTTTLSAGLADKPISRNTNAKERASGRSGDKSNHHQARQDNDDDGHFSERQRPQGSNADRSLDTISVSSLNGPNATKIKVPYRHVIEIQQVGAHSKRPAGNAFGPAEFKRDQRQQGNTVSSIAVEKSSSEMSFQEDIERLSKRLANISKSDPNEKHFNYKTVMANIEPKTGQTNQVISAYNARLEQNSPFQMNPILQTETMAQDNSNKQFDFSPSEYYVKYRATPALVDESALLTGKKNYSDNDEDRMSQFSSSCCSLQSSRTYKIRTIAPEERKQNNQSEETGALETNQPQEETVEFDENGNSKRPAAWIYDPRDGSSTAIIPPKRPETPKVDTKAEELAQSRGGRSYYLEILDDKKKKKEEEAPQKKQQLGSMSSLYSRWTSQGALNNCEANANSTAANLDMGPPTFSYRPLTPAKTPAVGLSRSTKQLNSVIAQHEQNRDRIELQQKLQQRRQLPFGGPLSTLGDKSKSSSCLLTVTKPSKYSIYGGFRKPDETKKPVPRLSYSRAIGPRSQRVDSLPRTPSRYLKMR